MALPLTYDAIFARYRGRLPVNYLRALGYSESRLNPRDTGGSYWGILQVGINNLRGYYSTEWGYIFAGVMVAALPVILAYVLLTKQFIRGLTAGALKG